MREKTKLEKELLKLQAAYSLWALAQAAGLAPRVLKRILQSAGVRLLRTGRAVHVPLAELDARIPELWRSIILVERLRAGVTGAT